MEVWTEHLETEVFRFFMPCGLVARNTCLENELKETFSPYSKVHDI